MTKKASQSIRNSWLAVAFSVSAFASTHFARMNWSVMTPFVEETLGLTKTMSGLLMTSPFITYALMQIPAGTIADRVDNGRLMGIALIVTGAITLATSFFTSFSAIFLLRLAVGFAASFVFTPSLRLLSLSVARAQKGKAIGIFFMAPTLALIVLGLVIPPVILSFGWQLSVFVTGLPGILTGSLVLAFSRSAPGRSHEETESSVQSFRKGMLQVLGDPNLLLCFLATFMSGFSLSGAKMWLVDYLIAVVGVTGVFAGMVYSLFNVITVLNKPVSGWTSDLTQKRKPIISISLFLTALVCFLIAVSPDSSLSLALVLCLGAVLGFQLTASTALVTELSRVETLGIAISTQNMMGMLSYSFQSPLAGLILDSTGAYLWVWLLFAITAALAALLYAFVKE